MYEHNTAAHLLRMVRFVDEMPDARLVWVEECGHVPHLEQPDETAKAIVSFVKDGNPAKVCTVPEGKLSMLVTDPVILAWTTKAWQSSLFAPA